jgi:GNAT superfamily N-acetyltransferase
MALSILPFRPDLAPAFTQLNRAWIERLFHLEPADLKTLQDPATSIIAPGGMIFFALDGTAPVGTVAAVRVSDDRFELAKMAVRPSHQGQGAGRLLGEAVITWVRGLGATTLFLLTNRSLTGAIRLYERLGFQHLPLPTETGYARADVYMELDLGEQEVGSRE